MFPNFFPPEIVRVDKQPVRDGVEWSDGSGWVVLVKKIYAEWRICIACIKIEETCLKFFTCIFSMSYCDILDWFRAKQMHVMFKFGHGRWHAIHFHELAFQRIDCTMTYHSHDSLTHLPSSRQYYPLFLLCLKVGTNLQSLLSLSTLAHKDRLIGGYFTIVQPPACASGSTSKGFLFLPIIGELLQSILTKLSLCDSRLHHARTFHVRLFGLFISFASPVVSSLIHFPSLLE